MSKVLKWLDNFWYHHKWTVIVVTFFVSLAVVLAVQLATREEYDAYIMYVGDAAIPDTQYADIRASLNSMAKDYDENKEISVNFSRTAFISDKEHEMASTVNAAATEFLSSLSVQPYYIYLMTPVVYDLYKDNTGLFVPISELEIDIPEEWYKDEQAVVFSKTDFARFHAGVSTLTEEGEELILVIKSVPYSHSNSVQGQERTSFEHHYDLLKSILEYRK